MIRKNIRNHLSIIGAATELGQKKPGTELAPAWLRLKGLREELEKRFLSVKDAGDITSSFEREDLGVFETFSKNLCRGIRKEIDQGRHVLTIGGDHSVAVGTLAASLSYDENIKIVWVDAHADINTFKTSPSGNLHGMPLAFFLELIEKENAKELFSWLPKLKPENIVYIGLRDVDEGEEAFLEKLGIKHYTGQDVRKLGIKRVMTETILHLDPLNESNFHISFDVDALDPLYVPATGTRVEGGLTVEEGEFIIGSVDRLRNLVALDLVEVNPALATPEELYTTYSAVSRLLSSYELRRDYTSEDLFF